MRLAPDSARRTQRRSRRYPECLSCGSFLAKRLEVVRTVEDRVIDTYRCGRGRHVSRPLENANG